MLLLLFAGVAVVRCKNVVMRRCCICCCCCVFVGVDGVVDNCS